MMKKRIFIVTLLLICSLSFAFPASAAIQASDQIIAYEINVLPASESRIAIEFSVTGAGRMAVIGAKSITIYEKNGLYWSYADGCTQDDEGMTRTNALKHSNTIYFDGESGKEYRIHVTVFAEDSSGESDSRSESFYVTAE